MRILVVDDFEPWRRLVRLTLLIGSQLEVVGEASNGLEAIRQVQQLQPDLILLDVGLPTLNGIETARRIIELAPDSKILFLSESRSSHLALEALAAGAAGYVVKSDAANELLPAINAVLRGKQFLSASLAGQVLATMLSSTQTMHLWWTVALLAIIP